MSTKIRYIRSTQADATLAGDRAAIFHRDTRNAITLNPTGTLLWQELTVPKTHTELVQYLLTRYPDLKEDTAASDVDKFLAELQSHRLLEIQD